MPRNLLLFYYRFYIMYRDADKAYSKSRYASARSPTRLN